jgi:hypothetical protein
MEVYRGGGACGTNIIFSGKEQSVTVGPLPDVSWARATRFKAVSVDKYEPELGYLRAPHCSSPPSGISDRDFDELLGRNAACKQVCSMTAAQIMKYSSRVSTEISGSLMTGYITSTLPSTFRESACHSSCMVSKGYRQCLLTALDASGAVDFLNRAGMCEERRP